MSPSRQNRQPPTGILPEKTGHPSRHRRVPGQLRTVKILKIPAMGPAREHRLEILEAMDRLAESIRQITAIARRHLFTSCHRPRGASWGIESNHRNPVRAAPVEDFSIPRRLPPPPFVETSFPDQRRGRKLAPEPSVERSLLSDVEHFHPDGKRLLLRSERFQDIELKPMVGIAIVTFRQINDPRGFRDGWQLEPSQAARQADGEETDDQCLPHPQRTRVAPADSLRNNLKPSDANHASFYVPKVPRDNLAPSPSRGEIKPTMLEQLKIRDFRCWEKLDLTPNAGRNFITGPNASGKTSILEAICCLLRLQSPRTSSLADIVRRDSLGALVEGTTAKDHLALRYSPDGRRIRLNGKNQPRSADYLAVGLIGWLGNDDMHLVKGAAAGRRRFLDFVGSQIEPSYLQHLRRYDRALRSRNYLLKREDHPSESQLAAYASLLVEHGIPLLQTRRKIVEQLSPLVAQAAIAIGESAQELAIAYEPGSPDDLDAALQNARNEERRLRSTPVGPHRDELALLLDRAPADTFASEGQQRTYVLALKLAQFQLLEQATGRTPILLIDDIFGELDPTRRNAFLDALPPHAQTFITTTSLDWTAIPPEATHYRIANQTAAVSPKSLS